MSFTSLNPFTFFPVKCITGNDTNYYHRLVFLTGVPLAILIALELKMRAEKARILLAEKLHSRSASTLQHQGSIKHLDKDNSANRIQMEVERRQREQKFNNLVYIQQILLFLVYPACSQVALSTFRCIKL